MARIPRKTQKVFCGNSNAGEIAVFGTMKTGTPQYSTDIETLQSNVYEQGWSDAILNDKAPYLEEMNGVQYAFSRQIAYLLQQGLANEWDTNTIYFKGSTVAVINNTSVTYYKSVSNDNQGNNPTTDGGTNWVLDSISKIESYNTALTNAINTLNSQVVKLSGNQTIYGTKVFNSPLYVPASTTAGTALGLVERGNYYIKFGDGTMLQWGSGNTTNGIVYIDMYKSYSFSYEAFITDSGGQKSVSYFKVQEKLTNQRFLVRSQATSGNDAFKWFAIGR